MSQINDPVKRTGSRVTDDGRQYADVVSRSAFRDALRSGKSFDVEINGVTLTDDAEAGLMFIRNDSSSHNLLVERFFHFVGNTTGGSTPASGANNFRVIKNPKGGTLLTAGTALTPENRLFGNNTAAPNTTIVSVTAFTGVSADGQTATGGQDFFVQERVETFPFSINFAVDLMLAPGSSVACMWSPPTGNTSQLVGFGCQFHYEPVNFFNIQNL